MTISHLRTIRRIRVKFITADSEFLYVQPVIHSVYEVLKVRFHKEGYIEGFHETVARLWRNAQLNLLDVIVEQDIYIPSFIVLEPDYLLDISLLAECFREYGAHPINYLLNRLNARENTRSLLLGNIANLFLDEWIHAGKCEPDFIACMKKAFRLYPIELATCEDLQFPIQERDFVRDCLMHFNHIKEIVSETFTDPVYHLDKNDAVLEPSYICEALGIQGRLDYMQQDMSSFIEMKSGKGDEMKMRGKILPKENNWTQMLLYMAVLEYSMNHSHRQTVSYLLYTRYPLLYPARVDWAEVKRIINVRNLIVANEYETQAHNHIDYTKEQLRLIAPDTLNLRHLHGKFWENYLRPTITRYEKSIASLSELEQAYYYTLYNFITKELYLSKTGSIDYYGRTGASSLWLNNMAEKKEAGEILYNLRLEVNKASEEHHPFVILSIPVYDDWFVPNFRKGDAVVLYECNVEEDNVTNKMIFKGNIANITDTQVCIRLRSAQRNLSVFPLTSYYALEHDSMDTAYRGMYLGLSSFIVANKERRDLLLGQRIPQFNASYINQIEQEDDSFERMALKAEAAEDYFLLVGPPGTGKTSRALRRMIERFYMSSSSCQILLLAYTNRAVDEICQSISSITPIINYIRVGTELTCDERFHEHLLPNVLSECTSRREVVDCINDCRVFVGTVSSISMRPELFKLKCFDVAIIDEATQILEPQLLGVLTARFSDGRNAIGKFILIGDPKQLPAVVLQPDELSEVQNEQLRGIGIYNLRNSLFERLYRWHHQQGNLKAVDMLCKQGRMHPMVAQFPNRAFYFGKLESLGLEHQKEKIDRPVLFIPSKPDLTSPYGKTNTCEAHIVSSLAKRVYESEKDHFDVGRSLGIITPYRSQIALIRKSLYQLGIPILNQISIDTVERYQGSERDVIIYSFSVNEPNQLQWLPNLMEEDGVLIDRKLNVALTRARKRMLITGVPDILKRNAIYAHLLDSIPWFPADKLYE